MCKVLYCSQGGFFTQKKTTKLLKQVSSYLVQGKKKSGGNFCAESKNLVSVRFRDPALLPVSSNGLFLATSLSSVLNFFDTLIFRKESVPL